MYFLTVCTTRDLHHLYYRYEAEISSQVTSLEAKMFLPGRNKMEQKYLTISQAAKVYNISTSTLYKLSARREMPLLKLGSKKVLIPVSEFEAWLQSHRVDGGQRKGDGDL